MRKTLLDVMTASREHDCPIVHISRLAGEQPIIASSPCLGNAPVPLIDITPDDYLAIMAELRTRIAVEHNETLAFQIFTGGARDPRAGLARVQLAPRTIAGSITLGQTTAAVYYMLDSAGQETTIIYDGLRSFADIQDYWLRRGQLVRAFTEQYAPSQEDVHDLYYYLDRTTQLATFDLDALAQRRGLTENIRC
jgi:hypothetical protein